VNDNVGVVTGVETTVGSVWKEGGGCGMAWVSFFALSVDKMRSDSVISSMDNTAK
jgi:hypothetical protein